MRRPIVAAVLMAVLATVAVAVGSGALPRPVDVRQPGAFLEAPVTESSGVIPSRRYPGRFWTLNDSGNPATLFLADTTGRIVHFVRLPIINRDWEALSAGPCGPDWCLYVGDIGDNRAVRPTVAVYRVVEPEITDAPGSNGAVRDSIVIEYPDGPRDAEGLVATRAEGVAIITKGGHLRAHAYWIPPDSWRTGRATATPLGPLPVRSFLLVGRFFTDAALSSDERTLAVRTYREIWLFRRGDRSGPIPDQPAGGCAVDGLDRVGEGIAWWNDSTLILTAEIRGRGPITLLRCPGR